MATVPLLYRHSATGFIEPVNAVYTGTVPEKIFKRLNTRFLKLQSAGYFYPCEPLDAYQAAIASIEAKAEEIAAGRNVLTSASLETYLTSVAAKSLHNFHSRVVAPMRVAYRRTETRIVGAEETKNMKEAHNAAEGSDVGDAAYAAACEAGQAEEPTPMTVQQLAEALPGEPDAATRYREAKAILAEICARLPRIVVLAFWAYVEADGDLRRAANLIGMPICTFYRKWPRWIALARHIATKEL